MKYRSVQWINRDPCYMSMKKHYCPNCNTLLRKIKVTKILHSSSPEAMDFNCQTIETYMAGNVKFIWVEFKCPSCEKQFTINEMKRIELGDNQYSVGKIIVRVIIAIAVLFLCYYIVKGLH